MEIDWKVSAVFAGIAFLLAFLSGAMAGVGFGTLLLRAILGALVFAVVGGGISFAINRYIPDLKRLGGGSSSPDSEDSAQRPGQNVDIVVEGDEVSEGADAPSMFEESEEESEDDSEADGDADEPRNRAGNGGVALEEGFDADEDDDEGVEFAEEAGEEGTASARATGGDEADDSDIPDSDAPIRGPSERSFGGAQRTARTAARERDSKRSSSRRARQRAGTDPETSDDLVEEVEEAEADFDSESNAEPAPREESEEVLRESVESLPDMEGLSATFGSAPEDATPDRPAASGSAPDAADPETIARALRTVLKRDQS